MAPVAARDNLVSATGAHFNFVIVAGPPDISPMYAIMYSLHLSLTLMSLKYKRAGGGGKLLGSHKRKLSHDRRVVRAKCRADACRQARLIAERFVVDFDSLQASSEGARYKNMIKHLRPAVMDDAIAPVVRQRSIGNDQGTHG